MAVGTGELADLTAPQERKSYLIKPAGFVWSHRREYPPLNFLGGLFSCRCRSRVLSGSETRRLRLQAWQGWMAVSRS